MGPFSVMIARFPGGNSEHPDSSGYVIDLAFNLPNDKRISKVVPFKLSDTPITMSRNRCVKNAIDRKIDYLLMLDSDMSPDTELLAPPFWGTSWDFMMERRLKEQEADEAAEEHGHAHAAQAYGVFPPATIAAPYCGPPPHECVYVFRWAGKASGDADQSFKLEMFDRDDACRKSGIEEVAALPTGLILYDMRVFRKLPPPWFRYEWTDGYELQKASTEDVYQTRNASLMGMPQFCNWDTWAGHVKTKVVCKPKPLTCQSMRKEFRDAILRNDRVESDATISAARAKCKKMREDAKESIRKDPPKANIVPEPLSDSELLEWYKKNSPGTFYLGMGTTAEVVNAQPPLPPVDWRQP